MAIPWHDNQDDPFRIAVEASPNGMVIVDQAGGIIYANRFAFRLFGYTPEELIGQRIETLVPTRYRATHVADRTAFHAAPTTRAMGHGRDLYGVRKDGSEFPVEIGLNPMILGDIPYMLASVIDITERKEQARRLSELVAELARSNQDLEQFASVAAHDLQEPLRKIRMFGDILRTQSTDHLEESNRDALKRMISAAERMQNLISDLLHYSRIASQEPQKEAVDLNAVLSDVLSDFEERLESMGGVIRIDTLPTITGDTSQVRQLFANLIGNAIKFRRKDVPPEIHVSTRTASETQDREIVFKDNGIGFDNQYAERIFGFFQRLHGRKEYEGTGLGLAICRKIAERLGGTIRADGMPGVGATFTIRLPAQREE
ncbi:MAG: PAS domain S-box protein [Myxococcales bacterium]|nr:PAS domain S-box protein [Myxococcales bacterium]